MVVGQYGEITSVGAFGMKSCFLCGANSAHVIKCIWSIQRLGKETSLYHS